jgi:hypothetical protein
LSTRRSQTRHLTLRTLRAAARAVSGLYATNIPAEYSDAHIFCTLTAGGIDALGTVIAEVELADGTTGVGISIGGEPACFIIENHLARFVEGQDVRNLELMWWV